MRELQRFMQREDAKIPSFLVNDADFLCLDLIVDAGRSDGLEGGKEREEKKHAYHHDHRDAGV